MKKNSGTCLSDYLDGKLALKTTLRRLVVIYTLLGIIVKKLLM
jgi:hypothetical protein